MKDSNYPEKLVLVVDDNPGNLGLAANYLKNAGYTVAVASSGSIALERAERVKPVVILLDINMPDLNGFEVCRKLKENDLTKNIPVIFLTAFTDAKSITKGFQVGAIDYLTKPVNKDELLVRVLTHMENFLYKNNLEQEVGIRTAELKESNKLLKGEITRHMETEENLGTILNSIGDAVIATDMDGKIVRINPVAENLTGWTSDQAQGLPLSEVFSIINALTRERCENPVKKVIRTGKIIGLANHTLLISKSGAQYQISDSAAPIRDNHGNTTGVVLVFRDVTEEYRVQEALRQSEERLNLAMYAANDGLWDWHLDTNTVDFDSRYYTLAGYESNEFPGAFKEWEKRIHPDDIQHTLSVIDQYLSGKCESYEVEFRFLRKDGDYMWIRGKGKVVAWDEKGKPSRFIGTHSDVTERKRIENALQKSEERYRLIAENVADVIWTMDMDFQTTYISPSVYQMRGFSVKEAMKQSQAKIMFPDSHKKMMNLYDKKIKQIEIGNPEGWEPVVYEVEQSRKDGTIIWTSNNARILPGAEKQPAYILGISRDITERKQAEELMIQSEKMISVGGLAAGMAHEINNPLGIVIALSQIIERRISPEAEKNIEVAKRCGIDLEKANLYLKEQGISKNLVGIREAGTRAADIVRDMLDFSHKSDTVHTVCNIQNMLDKAVDLACNDYDLKKSYDFRAIQINRQYNETNPLVNAIETEIEQVFLNLLKNAAQAMAEKAYENHTPTITLHTRREKLWMCVEVEDNGPGMDEATRKRVFEPFFSTKEVGMGTGLGLSVSYFIITKNHDGEFQVESHQNKGTKFIIRLPLEDSEI